MAMNPASFLNSTTVLSPMYNSVSGLNNSTIASGSGNSSTYSNGVSFGDIKVSNIEVNGEDLARTLAMINKRLSILVPDPKKLEKFEALKSAYEHYLTLEALCYAETDTNE